MKAVHGGGWSMPLPGCFTPGKEMRYPLYGRLKGPQSQFGWVQKIMPTLGFDPRTVQLVENCCTNYTVLTHALLVMWVIIKVKEPG